MTTPGSEPQHVGPYRLIEKIGEGGMGVVHLAVGPDGGLAAVKVLRPWLIGGQDARDRFGREFAALRKAHGSRVADVLAADVTGDLPYIATRYVRGSSLDKVVADHGPLRNRALIRFADGLAEAVGSVHEAGVVHRDIKPGNVMMTDGGPVLIDFGLARGVDETRLTATGLVIGTPGYLAPEVVDGQLPGPAADVHGWAATVAFAATGKPPYGAGPAAVVLDRIRRGEVDLGEVEPGLASILQRALVADPHARPSVALVRSMLAEPDADVTVSYRHGNGAPPAPPGPVTTGSVTLGQPDAPSPAEQTQPELAIVSQLDDGHTGRTARKPKPPMTLWPDGIAPPLATWPARLVIVAAAAVVFLLLVVANQLGVFVLYAVLVTGRVAWRIRRKLYFRRVERGYQTRDNAAVAAGTPWYVLISMATSLLHVLLIGVVGYAAGWAVSLSPDADPAGPVVLYALVVIILTWLGPGASKVRHGVRGMAAPLERNRRAAWITFGVLLALVWLLLLIWENFPVAWPPGGIPEPPISA